MKKITVATWVTFVRVVLVVPFVALLLAGNRACMPWALGVFVVASISDAIDGYLARSRGEVSNMGAFLDPLADKMLVNSAFVCLAVIEAVPAWVPVAFICRDFAVDGIRMMSAREGKTVSASILGKLKTVFQMAAIIAILLERSFVIGIGYAPFDSMVVMWLQMLEMAIVVLAVMMSILSGVEYISKGWKELF